MPQSARILQNSFSAGEVTPLLLGHVDYERYNNSCQVLKNFLPSPLGGVFRRPGFEYIATTKGAAEARLISFIAGTLQAYILEMGGEYIRFYKNGGQIVTNDTDASIANGTFDDNINDWDDKSTGTCAISHNATDGRLSLEGDGTDVAWAEQDVAIGGSYQETDHVLKFRVAGIPGDKVQLRIGTTSTGDEVVADVEFYVGYHAYEFTAPASSPMYIQFRNTENTTVDIDNVELIDDSPVELETPYASADVDDINYCQSADVQYFAHEDYAPHILKRYGHYTWSLEQLWFGTRKWYDTWPPFFDKNETNIELTPDTNLVGAVNITAAADFFEAGHVGSYIRFYDTNGDWGYCQIRSVASATSASGYNYVEYTSAAATKNWAETWSDYRGWPAAVGFTPDDRLAWAGHPREPERVWGSVIGDYENHDLDAADDDDAWRHRVGAQSVSKIRHILTLRQKLVVLAFGNEWQMGQDAGGMTPGDCPRYKDSDYGSTRAMPITTAEGGLVFIQHPGRIVRLYDHDYLKDRYTGNNLIKLSEHLTRNNKLRAGAYQQIPNNILFFIRDDGIMPTLTLLPTEEIIAWARQETEGQFKSVASIPTTGDDTEVWVIASRTIGGQAKHYVERMARIFRANDTMDARFLDSWLAWSGDSGNLEDVTNADPAVVTITGHPFSNGDTVRISGVEGMTELNNHYYTVANKTADTFELEGIDSTDYAAYESGGTARKCADTFTNLGHLEGKDVGILADGAPVKNETVSSAEITIDREASKVCIGLNYDADLVPTPPMIPTREGSVLSLDRRITQAMIKFADTFGAQFGPDEDHLEDVPFWDSESYLSGAPPELFSGDKTAAGFGSYGTGGTVMVRQPYPLPCHILAIVYTIEV